MSQGRQFRHCVTWCRRWKRARDVLRVNLQNCRCSWCNVTQVTSCFFNNIVNIADSCCCLVKFLSQRCQDLEHKKQYLISMIWTWNLNEKNESRTCGNDRMDGWHTSESESKKLLNNGWGKAANLANSPVSCKFTWKSLSNIDSSSSKMAFKNGPMSGGTGVAASDGQLEEAEDAEWEDDCFEASGGRSSKDTSRGKGSGSCSNDAKYASKKDQ